MDVVFDQTLSGVRARGQALRACALFIFLAVTSAAAEPLLMTDADLDAVAARGTVDDEGNPTPSIDLNGLLAHANQDGTGALFTIDTLDLFGSGGVDVAGLNQPGGFSFNGDLSNAVLDVEQLSFIVNLNLCVNCTATEIHQTGVGVPILFAAPRTDATPTP